MEFAIPELRKRPDVHAIGARRARFQRLRVLAAAARDAASRRRRGVRPRERDLRRPGDASAVARLGLRRHRAARAVPPHLQRAAQQARESHRRLRGHALLDPLPVSRRCARASITGTSPPKAWRRAPCSATAAPNGPRLQQAFETTNRYVLQFFNAYLKKDAGGAGFPEPRSGGERRSCRPGRRSSVCRRSHRRRPSTRCSRSSRARASTRRCGGSTRRERLIRRRDLFREAGLNRLGLPRAAIAVHRPSRSSLFRRIVELFPASSNAYDSLAEALEAAGERREAVEVTGRRTRSAGEAGADSPEQRRDMAETAGGAAEALEVSGYSTVHSCNGTDKSQ